MARKWQKVPIAVCNHCRYKCLAAKKGKKCIRRCLRREWGISNPNPSCLKKRVP